MTDPLKVNQSDRDARARECLAATVGNDFGAKLVRDHDGNPLFATDEIIRAMLAFADAEVGCVPEGPSVDSAVYKMTFFGILNADGDFWTPLAFESPKKAKAHIANFWGGAHTENAKRCMKTHRIVPVRIVLSAMIEAQS